MMALRTLRVTKKDGKMEWVKGRMGEGEDGRRVTLKPLKPLDLTPQPPLQVARGSRKHSKVSKPRRNTVTL
jgi:hypothetical protein